MAYREAWSGSRVWPLEGSGNKHDNKAESHCAGGRDHDDSARGGDGRGAGGSVVSVLTSGRGTITARRESDGREVSVGGRARARSTARDGGRGSVVVSGGGGRVSRLIHGVDDGWDRNGLSRSARGHGRDGFTGGGAGNRNTRLAGSALGGRETGVVRLGAGRDAGVRTSLADLGVALTRRSLAHAVDGGGLAPSGNRGLVGGNGRGDLAVGGHDEGALGLLNHSANTQGVDHISWEFVRRQQSMVEGSVTYRQRWRRHAAG